MANYATQTDMENRFGTEQVKLAFDRDGDGVVDAVAITACLTEATAEIDSYVGARYELPLDTVPEFLKHLCCDIAIYRASLSGLAYTEEKRVRYEDAIKWLDKLAKGLVTLGADESSEEVYESPQVSDNTQTRLFTRTTQRGIW